MGARDVLLSLLYGERSPALGVDDDEMCSREADADRILRIHAHELAEKIRNSESLRNLTDDHMGDCNAAADLIDPEGA